jgi:hypothetical protein
VPEVFRQWRASPSRRRLDLYLRLLRDAYAATPAEGLRTRQLAEGGRVLAGSEYLGAVVPETANVHNELESPTRRAVNSMRQSENFAARSRLTRFRPDSLALGAALAERGALDEPRNTYAHPCSAIPQMLMQRTILKASSPSARNSSSRLT